MKKQNQRKIKLSWEVKEKIDTGRVTAMYCYKNCSVNQF